MEKKQEAVAEFNVKKGLLLAIISGILSACFNFGLEAGKPMAIAAELGGANPLFRNNVVFVVVLWGGLTTNFIWCMILNAWNKTFGDYNNKKLSLGKNYIFFCACRYNLVPAVLFLRYGRKQTGQWSQLLDPAHGLYYPGI